MSSVSLHEPPDLLSNETKDLHRAIVSLMEELEAVDWYQQRAEVCSDDELRGVLVHNKNEEIEHAMMTLEWLRRNDPAFATNIATYLGSSGPITEVEKRAPAASGAKAVKAVKAAKAVGAASGSLGIGSLKEVG